MSDGFFFQGNTPETGRELWFSDGTAEGIRPVADLNPGADDSRPAEMVVVGDRVFFAARSAETGYELYVSDGTPEGTRLVRDIAAGPDSGLPDFNRTAVRYHAIAYNGLLYFTAKESDDLRYHLWRSDGTEEGTFQITDLGVQVQTNQQRGEFLVWNDLLYFVGNQAGFGAGVTGQEVYRTDGTAAGTELVYDAAPGSFNGAPLGLAVLRDSLYFFARNFDREYDLFRSDGTPAGTERVFDLPGVGQDILLVNKFGPVSMVVNDRLVFSAVTPGGPDLWSTDGSAQGTRQLADPSESGVNYHPSYFTRLEGAIFYVDYDGATGYELWRTDGTPEGTRRVTDLNPGQGDGILAPSFLTTLGNRLYFTAYVNATFNKVVSVNAAGEDLVVYENDPALRVTGPREYITFAGDLYFYGLGRDVGYELYTIRDLEIIDGISVVDATAAGVSVFPNPVRDRLTVRLAQSAATGYELIDVMGRVHQRRRFADGREQFPLTLPDSAPVGPLLLRLRLRDGRVAISRLLRQ